MTDERFRSHRDIEIDHANLEHGRIPVPHGSSQPKLGNTDAVGEGPSASLIASTGTPSLGACLYGSGRGPASVTAANEGSLHLITGRLGDVGMARRLTCM